jgi:hypothetical protein
MFRSIWRRADVGCTSVKNAKKATGGQGACANATLLDDMDRRCAKREAHRQPDAESEKGDPLVWLESDVPVVFELF